MNEFPHVKLTHYTTFCVNDEHERVKGDGMRMFASELKAWLKNANLNLEFIGHNLGKSLSTIRNWMTGNVWVHLSKLDNILQICQAHEAGGQGLMYKGLSDDEEIDFIWVRPYLRVELPQDYENRKRGDGSRGASSHEPAVAHYERWCAIAKVPEDTLYRHKGLFYPALARFVTDTIMKATRKALIEAQESGKLNTQFIRQESSMRDIGAVLQGRPCDCCFHENKILSKKGVFEPTFSPDSEICFYLPVIKSEWRSDFVRWAARLSGTETTDLWIVEQLNQRARRKLTTDYRKFIKAAPQDLEE